MDRGTIIFRDRVSNLLSQSNVPSVAIDMGENAETAYQIVSGHPGVKKEGSELRLNSVRGMGELLAVLEHEGILPVSIHTNEPSLENLFLHLTGRQLRDDS